MIIERTTCDFLTVRCLSFNRRSTGTLTDYSSPQPKVTSQIIQTDNLETLPVSVQPWNTPHIRSDPRPHVTTPSSTIRSPNTVTNHPLEIRFPSSRIVIEEIHRVIE